MKPNDAELVVMFFLFIFALLLGFGLYVLSSNSPSFSEIFAGRKTSLIYLFTGFVSATIILVLALSSRPRKRTSKLEGLVSGYGCSDFRFRPMFPSDLHPSGFEDLWECCLLGQGGWGSAYLCRRGEVKVVLKVPKGFELLIEESGGDKPSGTSKELMKELMEEKELMEKLEKVKYEAEAISKLDHPNIIKLLGYSERAPLLIYEYADHGTLHWQLSKGWKPSQKDILLIGVELSDALRYIHSRGLVHGDIKPGNVFIKDGVIKLGDFSSIVKTLSSISPSEILDITIGFRAPEQVYRVLGEKAKKEGYENRIDIYQLANLILYMLIRESIDGEDAIDEKRVKEKLNKVQDKELRKILDEALVHEPSKRPSSEELRKAFKTLYEKYEKIT
jgi:serine/threonine protein kinase